MKVFELNFNSRGYKKVIEKQNPSIFDKVFPQKEKMLFESFCFFPKTQIEKNLPGLFFLGQNTSQSPRKRLLTETAERIRNYYFSQAGIKPISQALKYAFSKTNSFLQDQQEQSQFHPKENFSLDIAIACLSAENVLHLTKIGSPTVLLLSCGEAYDLASNIASSFPSRPIFQNVVEGALKPGDKIFVATNNVFQFFLENDFLRDVAEITGPKEMKVFLKEKNSLFKEIHGVCLIIVVEPPKKPFFLFRPFIKDHSPIPAEGE